PHPMVMTMSAACTLSLVSGLGNSREMSTPISAMAATTAGLSWLAGWDPAEVTRTRPAAARSRRAAAIWDRPALWVQTNRTSGMRSIGRPSCLAHGRGRSSFGGGRAGEQGYGQRGTEGTAEDLGGDEGGGGGGRDAGVGGGEGP